MMNSVNRNRVHEVLWTGLFFISSAAAAFYQQLLLTLISGFCLLKLGKNPSFELQLINQHYQAITQELKAVNTGLSSLSLETTQASQAKFQSLQTQSQAIIEQVNGVNTHLSSLQEMTQDVQEVNAKMVSLTQEILNKLPSSKTPLPQGQRGRVSILIDDSNIFLETKALKKNLDYQKLKAVFSEGASQLVKAVLLASVDSTKEKEIHFLNRIESYGYQVISQELVQHKDGSKEGNLDPEIMLQMVRCLDISDTVVLLSGDGDFVPFVCYLKEKGCRVEVYGFPANTNETLQEVADQYADLSTLDVFQDNFKSSPKRSKPTPQLPKPKLLDRTEKP